MAQTPHCGVLVGWKAFKKHFISKDGRVIDPATSNLYTTSEGQSYALFFALISNDTKMFAKLLTWTQNNLSGGDLTARLPAWQWGKQKSGRWNVSDRNSASDSDLWIAYSLLEAGKRFKSEYYTKVGLSLARRILDEETDVLPGLGLTLLPGPRGFNPEKNTWRLNPSYVPIFLLRAMYHYSKDERWSRLIISSQKLLLDSAPNGFSPDWAIYHGKNGFDHGGRSSSYNAIRVYMWAGMMTADDPLRQAQLQQFEPMIDYLERHGLPGEAIDIESGRSKNHGPVGFSAALLPFLSVSGANKALEQQLLRLVTNPLSEIPKMYYDQVLGLFAVNWMKGYYAFDRNGTVVQTCRP